MSNAAAGVQAATSLSGALAQNIPSGPAPAAKPAAAEPKTGSGGIQHSPRQQQQPATRATTPRTKGVRPSEFAAAISSGEDAIESDLPPEGVGLEVDESTVDGTRARLDEVKPEPDAEPEPQKEPEQPEEPQEYDEFGNPIDRRAEAQARAEWAEKLTAALKDGKIPHELLASLPVEVTVDGQSEFVPFEEMRHGYMRTSKFSKSMNEAYALKDRSEHILRLEAARTMEWRDHRALRHGLRQMGPHVEQAFFDAAREYAREQLTFKQMSPPEQALFLERQRFEQEREQFSMQQRMMAEQQQRQTASSATAQAAQLIQRFIGPALKAQGVGLYPRSSQLWMQNLEILCREDGQITPERAREAAIATREELAADRSRIPQRPLVPGGAQPGTQADQPVRQPSAAAAQRVAQNSRSADTAAVTSTGQRGMRPSDIRTKLGY